MSLSSSTLSLKFMQRGIARSQPSTPTFTSTPSGSDAKPSIPNQDQQSTPSSKPNQSYLSATASAAARGDKLIIQNEEEWFLPSSSRNNIRRTIKQEATGPIFESSYVPFLTSNSISPEAGPSTITPSITSITNSTAGGGGRMTFGGFGKKDQDTSKRSSNDNDDDDDYDEMEEDDDVAEAVRIAKQMRDDGRSVKAEPSSQPRTFLKPALSPPPSSTTKSTSNAPSSNNRSRTLQNSQNNSSSNTPKPMSVAEKMRQTITSSRNSPSSTPTSSNSISKTTSPVPSITTSSTSSTSNKKDKSKNKNKRPASERESSSGSNLTSPLISKKVKIEPNSQPPKMS
ncbi:uncharacterized protein L201_006124 [Kwoniella dendrophila CBS 6074]|uniref:Uncharacterized protein n=1 Tax=Kwoniella dendrophila CBS 6074 TaxID=1295534 RepID=A0AAX4K371_9TREE